MKKRKTNRWYRKIILGAFMWLAAKILEPIPVLRTLINIVAFAI